MIFQRLAFDNVTLRRDGGPALLEKVSLEFPLGTAVQLYGAQGVGVSSLLQCLVGLLRPSQGSYRINGEDRRALDPKRWYQYQLAIGYGFDHGGLISNCSLLDNLTLPLLYNRKQDPVSAEKTALTWLERFGAANSRSLLPALASTAAQKACLLARALILEPELVVLDQPTHGLHPDGVNRLIAILQEQQLHAGLSHLFLATEDEHLLEAFRCTRIEMARRTLLPQESGRAHDRAA